MKNSVIFACITIFLGFSIMFGMWFTLNERIEELESKVDNLEHIVSDGKQIVKGYL